MIWKDVSPGLHARLLEEEKKEKKARAEEPFEQGAKWMQSLVIDLISLRIRESGSQEAVRVMEKLRQNVRSMPVPIVKEIIDEAEPNYRRIAVEAQKAKKREGK